MKQFLLGFLIILTLMPVMACAMTNCPMKPVLQEQATKLMPCHQANKANAPMIIADCMGVDLFVSDLISDVPKSSDIDLEYFSFAWVDINIFPNITYLKNNAIRAPPPYSSNNLINLPSVILTTARIRS